MKNDFLKAYCNVGCRCESAVEEPRLSGVPGPCVNGVGIVSIEAEKETEFVPDTLGLTSLMFCDSLE